MNISEDRVKKALNFSQELIDQYEKSKSIQKQFHYGSQTLIIVLAGITPLLLLFEVPPKIASVPPAIASIAAGLANTFKYREKYVSNKVTLEEFKFERKKFELGISSYGNKNPEDKNTKDNIQVFIRKLEILHKNRMEEWRDLQDEYIDSETNLETNS